MCETTSNIRTGCSKWPFSKAATSEEARRTLRYVEPLNHERTPLAAFFSILLLVVRFKRRYVQAIVPATIRTTEHHKILEYIHLPKADRCPMGCDTGIKQQVP